MFIMIPVSFEPRKEVETKEILINTDNIEVGFPNGYDKVHKFMLIGTVSGSTYYITEAVYKKLINKIKVEKL